jgi:hypothetical protein
MEYKDAGTRPRAPRILGDSDIMRLRWNMPKAAWSCLSLLTMLFAAALVGCDSSSDPNSAEAVKNRQATAETARQFEDAANAKTGRNKKNAVVKSIKNFNTPPPKQ